MEAAVKEARGNYDTLMDAHLKLQAHLTEERETWARQEDRLRRENAELRAQLLYTAAQLATSGNKSAGNSAGANTNTSSFVDGTPAAGGLPTRAQPATPQPSSTNSLGQAIFGGAAARQDSIPGAAAAPSWAAEIEAAMEAVDHLDILTENVDYTQLARKRMPQPSVEPISTPQTPPPQATAPTAPSAAPPPAVSASAAMPPPPTPAVLEEEAPSPPPLAPNGPPPPLCVGSDDIFWMNQLHTALVDVGYYPGDEDIADYYYGEGTQSAVMTMQACSGLDETGVVDEETWIALLGPDLILKESRDLTEDQLAPYFPGFTPPGAAGKDKESAPAVSNGSSSQQPVSSEGRKPFAELFTSATEQIAVVGNDGEIKSSSSSTKISETDLYSDGEIVEDSTRVTQLSTRGEGGVVDMRISTSSTHRETTPTASAAFPTKWPVLIEGDGGHDVHALHVLLDEAGYNPGDDDVTWWQFGDTTVGALKTFQACSGLPESGICDSVTWKKLLGADATPAVLRTINSGASDDDDMADDKGGTRVWLIGEQRWEDRTKLGK